MRSRFLTVALHGLVAAGSLIIQGATATGIVTKAERNESNTGYAQGGIAAALGVGEDRLVAAVETLRERLSAEPNVRSARSSLAARWAAQSCSTWRRKRTSIVRSMVRLPR